MILAEAILLPLYPKLLEWLQVSSFDQDDDIRTEVEALIGDEDSTASWCKEA